MNIRADREAAGISQAELARRVGMHQPKLSKIENGHIEPTAGEESLIRTAIGTEVKEAEDYAIKDDPPYRQAVPVETVAERRAWVAQRNHAMQTKGVPAPASGIFGVPPKKKQS